MTPLERRLERLERLRDTSPEGPRLVIHRLDAGESSKGYVGPGEVWTWDGVPIVVLTPGLSWDDL